MAAKLEPKIDPEANILLLQIIINFTFYLYLSITYAKLPPITITMTAIDIFDIMVTYSQSVENKKFIHRKI